MVTTLPFSAWRCTLLKYSVPHGCVCSLLSRLHSTGPLCVLWFYNHQGFYLPCLAPLLALNSTVLFCLVSDFTFERIEEAKLRSTLQTRDDLPHMIVHDLRSPLTAVTG